MNRIRTLYARRGFTLIELIMVIAIIAFISAFMMFVIPMFHKKSRDEAAKAQLGKIATALSLYSGALQGLPPDTGYGQAQNGGLFGTTRLYDAGSLFHYLGETLTVDKYPSGAPMVPTKTVAPFLSFRDVEVSNTTYNDPERGKSRWIVDPWNHPVGYIGAPARVLHNKDGGVDVFSAGADRETASDLDAAGKVSYGMGGNVAYSSLGDNNGDGIDNNGPELGVAALNGTLTKFKPVKLPGENPDDHNNWEQ